MFKPTYCVSRSMRDHKLGERKLAWAKRIFIIHNLAGGDMNQPPPDRGQRRWLRIRYLVIIRPCTILSLINTPPAWYRLPEEILIGNSRKQMMQIMRGL